MMEASPTALKPGYYWVFIGQWVIVFLRSDGLIETRSGIRTPGISEEYKRAGLKGPILPPDKVDEHLQLWEL